MGASQEQGLSLPSAVGTIGPMPAPETSKLAYLHPGALVKLGRGEVMGQQWDLEGGLGMVTTSHGLWVLDVTSHNCSQSSGRL